jgi:hypothetical protein
MSPMQLGAQVVDQVQAWVPVFIAVAIALGPAWVVFRSRAIKEELKLLREDNLDLRSKLDLANVRIDAMQRDSADRVADRILERFEREGMFARRGP